MKFSKLVILSIGLLFIINSGGNADTYGFIINYNIIDITPPVTNISLFGTFGNNSWYTSNVTVTLSGIDDQSGMNYTTYNINNGSWFIYSVPFLITTENSNKLYYYSVDNAGNKEQINSQIINIDKIPPYSINNLVTSSIGRNYINWTWTDPKTFDSSGFAYGMIYINGLFKTNVSKGVQYYNATSLNNNRQNTISIQTVDNAGNINRTWINNTAKTLK